MVQRWTSLLGAGVTAVLLAVPTAGASDDTVRLGGNIDAKATTLAFDGQVETTLTRGCWGGCGRVRYRGVGVGFYGGYGYGGYGYGYGYYGPRYGYYRGWVPPVYVSVAPSYYYSPPVVYTPGCSYYPINLAAQVGIAPVVARPALQVAPAQREVIPGAPVPVPMALGGAFRYDGGPINPVPVPGDQEIPVYQPKNKVVPSDGRLVSMPSQTTTARQSSSFAYPAYGETGGAPSSFASDRLPATIVIGASLRNTLR